ncbi:MAG TPA: GNAT family N-acetyltransferase [Candidatus Dormibacteraeota bacterium]
MAGELRLYRIAVPAAPSGRPDLTEGQPASQPRTMRFDERFRDATWEWFRDPELRRLTGAKEQTKEEQAAWFESLPSRPDYRIWGVELDGRPAAVFGLKAIRADAATWFVFIGDAELRGRGLGAYMGSEVRRLAAELGIRHLRNRLQASNEAIVNLHRSVGFELAETAEDGFIPVHLDLQGEP